jgi:hypothetical protein
VALIRTDVSEDRIASIFRVTRRAGTSVLIRATRRHLPEDDNHHSHRRGNLKSYIFHVIWRSMHIYEIVCEGICVHDDNR